MIDLMTEAAGVQTLDGRFLSTVPTVTPEKIKKMEVILRDYLDNYALTPEILAHVIPFALGKKMEARGELDDYTIETVVAVEGRLVAIVLDGIAAGRTY